MDPDSSLAHAASAAKAAAQLPIGLAHNSYKLISQDYKNKTDRLITDIWEKINEPLARWGLNDLTLKIPDLSEGFEFLSKTGVFESIIAAADGLLSDKSPAIPSTAAFLSQTRHPAVKRHLPMRPLVRDVSSLCDLVSQLCQDLYATFVLDLSSIYPIFTHYMSSKPHSLVTLPEELRIMALDEGDTQRFYTCGMCLSPSTEAALARFSHPYERELRADIYPALYADAVNKGLAAIEKLFGVDQCAQDAARLIKKTRGYKYLVDNEESILKDYGAAALAGGRPKLLADVHGYFTGLGLCSPFSLGLASKALLSHPAIIPSLTTIFQYESIFSTPLRIVTTREELEELIVLLKASPVPVIGVDVEHHSERCYFGITSLIQLSFVHESSLVDVIIDPYELFDCVYLLRDVFADPNIIKVFHGAHMDVLWLQRDFRLYVVGLFDTYHAAKQLGLQKSLRGLVYDVFGIILSKEEQLSDWSIRPLTHKQYFYARNDTHWLIPAFQVLAPLLLSSGHWPDFVQNCVLYSLKNYTLTSISDVYRFLELQMPLDLANTSSYTADAADLLRVKVVAPPDNPLEHWRRWVILLWQDLSARVSNESPEYLFSGFPMAELCALSVTNNAEADTAAVLNLFTTAKHASPFSVVRASEIAQLLYTAGRLHDAASNMPELRYVAHPVKQAMKYEPKPFFPTDRFNRAKVLDLMAEMGWNSSLSEAEPQCVDATSVTLPVVQEHLCLGSSLSPSQQCKFPEDNNEKDYIKQIESKFAGLDLQQMLAAVGYTVSPFHVENESVKASKTQGARRPQIRVHTIGK